LVTGGTGFVGAYVVAQLVADGHTVTTFDLTRGSELLEKVCDRSDEVDQIGGDVSDPFAVLGAMRSSKAERVIHLAATLSGLSDRNPLRALRVNCEGTINVFESALACDVERVVWASSIGVFGTPGVDHVDGHLPADVIPNDGPHLPDGIYGACKSFNERLAANYRRNRGLDSVGVRYAFTYGYGKAFTIARGTRVGFMTDLIDRPALGEPASVVGGDTVFDWVYVTDAARATILASTAPSTPSIALNVCGSRHTVREVASMVRDLVPDCDLKVEDGTWGDSLNYDPSAATDQIGYTAEIGLREGVGRTIEDVRRYAAAQR
jgi:nucleoside-diphosphate-sugar epimerase